MFLFLFGDLFSVEDKHKVDRNGFKILPNPPSHLQEVVTRLGSKVSNTLVHAIITDMKHRMEVEHRPTSSCSWVRENMYVVVTLLEHTILLELEGMGHVTMVVGQVVLLVPVNHHNRLRLLLL